MSQKIRDFYAKAQVADFSRDFLFRVLAISTGDLVFGPDELVYVRTASVPGRNINNVEAKFMGLSFNTPGGVTYPNSGSYSLEFYCDQNSTLREALLSESRRRFNDADSIGSYNTPGDDEYIAIAQLDKQLNPVTTYVLRGASIRDVGEVSYEISEGTGNYKVFTATFAYHYFENTSESPTALRNVFPNAEVQNDLINRR